MRKKTSNPLLTRKIAKISLIELSYIATAPNSIQHQMRKHKTETNTDERMTDATKTRLNQINRHKQQTLKRKPAEQKINRTTQCDCKLTCHAPRRSKTVILIAESLLPTEKTAYTSLPLNHTPATNSNSTPRTRKEGLPGLLVLLPLTYHLAIARTSSTNRSSPNAHAPPPHEANCAHASTRSAHRAQEERGRN